MTVVFSEGYLGMCLIFLKECCSHIERYVSFMRLLCDLCDGLPLQTQSIYELHSELQSNASFFTDRDGLFS